MIDNIKKVMEDQNDIFLKKLQEKEDASGLQYDGPKKESENIKNSLGKASYIEEQQSAIGMESPWKPLPIVNLPSEGFGYPPGLEIGISASKVSEIRHYSTIDEHDPIDVSDKINHILSKNTYIKYKGGVLSYMDLYHEDRFYIFMAIRDLTFIKGENRLMIPLNKDCKDDNCILEKEIELRSGYLTSFKLPVELQKYYDIEKGCYVLTPKNGESQIELFIPTIGVVTRVNKIIRDKKERGKKYDEIFAKYATYIIPNWRDLNEELYDYFEQVSQSWTYVQFNIVDKITEKINFATKNQISLQCSKCRAEVTAPLRFPGGIRSLYIISDIFTELL